MQLTNADWLAIEREYCARSFAGFCKRAWPVVEPSTPLVWGWAMDAICSHLEAVADGRIKRLLINVPPGMSKSTLCNVMFPAWIWTKRPHMRFVGTAYEEGLAVRDSRKCREVIRSEWYQSLWKVPLLSDLDGKREFGNTSQGVRQARSFASVTGVRGDGLIIDDPISVAEANSATVLQEREITFTETLPNRTNSDDSFIVVIMQRIHEGDTSGVILSRDLGYTHLCLPMEFETDRRCTTSIGFSDPRTKEGELLFPERFSREMVDGLKKAMGSYAFAGQYQQRPAPRGGGMFKREWFNTVGAVPVGTKFVRGWDLAASTDQESAYTAGVKIGRTPQGKFIIAHVARAKETPAGVERLIVNTASQDGVDCRGSIPQDPGQAGKAQVQYLIGKLAGYSYRASPETGDKTTRAEPLAAQAEAGNVDILAGDWNRVFLDEIATFPMSKFKDQVDAATRAFNEFVKPQAAAAIFGTYGTG